MSASSDRWRARPWVARALRIAIVCVPLAAGYGVTMFVAQSMREQIGQSRWWLLVPAIASLAVCIGVERLTRRLLPLAALLKLTMLFPDRAPARFKVARQAMNVRTLRATLQTQPANTASTAAEAALALITALTAHDRRTRGHCERVRVFTELLGEQLRLTRDARDKLRWVSLLHDIGKLQVATEILNKPSKLDKSEWDVVSAHPEMGAELLGPLRDWLGEWAAGVRQHHEKYDGTGYPDGAAGEQISRSGRIVAIADSYEVMTAHRAYKKPMATSAARAELARCAGTQFDPAFVRAFLAVPLPRLFWAMGPGSLLMNLPLLRAAADAANKGVLASAQSGVTAVSAAAVIGGVSVASAATPVSSAATVGNGATQNSPVAVASPQHSAPTRSSASDPGPGPSVPSPSDTAPVAADPVPSPSASSSPSANSVPSAAVTSTGVGTATVVLAPAPPAPITAPGMPADTVVKAGDQQATVYWTAPADDGGSPVTGYVITPIGPSGPLSAVVTGAATTSVLIAGLTNGAVYTFEVAAVNAVGSSAASVSAVVTPAGAPSVPPSASAAAGDQQAVVTWATPSSDGGAPISAYTVTPVGPAGPLASVVTGPNATSVQISGLTNGTAYTFSVVASNDASTSAAVTTTAVVPVGVPQAPGSAAATAGDGQALVSWTAANPNGDPVSSYTVTPVGPGGPGTAIVVPGTSTSTTITGLTDGSSYTFEVVAHNSVGASNSVSTAAITPLGLPGAPTAVNAVADDQKATVFWSAPAVDGGSPISGYTITPIGTGAPAPTHVGSSATTAVITGLTNGNGYTFSVTADTAMGSSAGAVTGSVTPSPPPLSATAPAAPLAPSAVAGPAAGQASITWSTPGDGGSPLTSYTVTALSGGVTTGSWTLPAAATSQLVTSLTPGTTYTFTVVATNAVGSSSTASTNPVVAIGAPQPVSAVTAVPGAATVALSWSPPASNGGSPVTSYTVTPFGPSGPLTPTTVAAPTTNAVISGLSNGTSYNFEVTASNAYGTSTPSSSNAVVGLSLANDTAYVAQSRTVVINPLANDHGSIVAAGTTIATPAAHGSATANSDGTVTYRPTGSYHGSDQFTYQACDSYGNCATASVVVNVLAPGQQNTTAYVGLDMSYANLQGIDFSNANLSNVNFTGANLTGVNFTGANLSGAIFTNATLTTANFHNITANGANFAGTNLTGLAFGSANLSGANLSGANMTNAALDNTIVSATTNLSSTILTGVHGGPAPQISSQTFATTTTHSVTINLLSLLTDADAPIDPTSLFVAAQPAHGTITLNGDGTATYTPTAGFTGADTFKLSVANVLTFKTTGDVHLSVTP
ncbi:MAG: fibronectin type III domain-containing protein [Actinobacteria bacterium]|nr:fibronectin type III domain-containing protein [Actinomycetota bacterium]